MSAATRPLQAAMTIDWKTGECFVVAKNGRRYSLTDVEAIERAASCGDRAAAAALAAIDHTPGGTPSDQPVGEHEADHEGEDEGEHVSDLVNDLVDDLEVMARSMHDCPLCQEERRRTGRDPEVVTSWFAGVDPPLAELAAASRRERRAEERRTDPHWWQGRRRNRGRR